MNQIPASILILTSSILAFTSTAQDYTTLSPKTGLPVEAAGTTAIGAILGLAGLVLGIWGVISLIGASVRDREMAFDGAMRNDIMGVFDPRRMNRSHYGTAPMGTPVQSRPSASTDPGGVHLTPEMKAQLSMAAHLEGRDRTQIIEEALRRYLPTYDNTKAA